MNDMSSFGAWLRQQRKRQDLTQAELAARAGCALGTLRNIETDSALPSRQLAARLAKALGVVEPDIPAMVAFARGTGPAPEAPDLPPAPAPAWQPRPATPVSLPAQLSTLIGHEEHVAAISGLLHRPDVRLVTLSGPGGIGKTSLAIACAQVVAEPALMAARQRALRAAAWLASDQHDYGQTTQLFAQRALISRALGQPVDETESLLNAARRARVEGHYQQAEALYRQALATHRAQGHDRPHGSITEEPAKHAFGQALRELGLVARERGDYAQATMLFTESLAFHKAVGDHSCVAFALLGLADVARDQGDAQLVHRYGNESLHILRKLDMGWAIGFTLNTLACGDLCAGDLAAARAHIAESEALFRELRSNASLAEILITRSRIAQASGDVAYAHIGLREALHLLYPTGPRIFIPAVLEGLASIESMHGDPQRAAQLLAAASTLRTVIEAPVRPVDLPMVAQARAVARLTLGAIDFDAISVAARHLPIDQQLAELLRSPDRY